MKQALNMVSGWISDITELLLSLLVVGVVVGILWDDPFGVIGEISALMTQLGNEGVAGLVALVVVLSWYKK